ncbi:hypothetical protein ACIBI9_67855 [Nonomuraea sp. NPDC050451]|uniref:hypothetical protein n=1 Tax=Nonomuraea sp. NPDC050451 TaxID=3364364 RepID=UPI0037B3C5BF
MSLLALATLITWLVGLGLAVGIFGAFLEATKDQAGPSCGICPASPKRSGSELVRWWLRSDWRTWAIFAPPLITATINVAETQGWGSAVWLIAGLTALDELIQRIRRHL